MRGMERVFALAFLLVGCQGVSAQKDGPAMEPSQATNPGPRDQQTTTERMVRAEQQRIDEKLREVGEKVDRLQEVSTRLEDAKWTLFKELFLILFTTLTAIAGAFGLAIYGALSVKLKQDVTAEASTRVQAQVDQAIKVSGEVVKIKLLHRLAHVIWERYESFDATRTSTDYRRDIEACVALAKSAKEIADELRESSGDRLSNDELLSCVEAANQVVYFEADARHAGYRDFSSEERRRLVTLAETTREEARRLASKPSFEVPEMYYVELDETFAWALFNFGGDSDMEDARELARKCVEAVPRRSESINRRFGLKSADLEPRNRPAVDPDSESGSLG